RGGAAPGQPPLLPDRRGAERGGARARPRRRRRGGGPAGAPERARGDARRRADQLRGRDALAAALGRDGLGLGDAVAPARRPRPVTRRAEATDGRRGAEGGQRLLAEVSEQLRGSLDAHERLAGLARLVVPRLADLCVLQLEEEERPAALAPMGRELVEATAGG